MGGKGVGGGGSGAVGGEGNERGWVVSTHKHKQTQNKTKQNTDKNILLIPPALHTNSEENTNLKFMIDPIIPFVEIEGSCRKGMRAAVLCHVP